MAETGSQRYESVVTVAHSRHVVITRVGRLAGSQCRVDQGDTGLGTSVGVWRVLERRQERGLTKDTSYTSSYGHLEAGCHLAAISFLTGDTLRPSRPPCC